MSETRDTLPAGGDAVPAGTSPTTYPMTTPNGAGTATPPGAGSTSPNGGLDTAKHEAAHVADTAKGEAAHVAETAKEEVKNVGREARTQLSRLYEETRSELAAQAADRQARLAHGLHSAGGELRGMADSSGNGGMATDVVRQASERLDGVAAWLEARDPGALVDEVKRYARRRPAMFLAFAALTGVVVGRLTRSLAAGAPSPNGSTRREITGSTAPTARTSAAGDYGTGFGAGASDVYGRATADGTVSDAPLRSTIGSGTRNDERSDDPLYSSREHG